MLCPFFYYGQKSTEFSQFRGAQWQTSHVALAMSFGKHQTIEVRPTVSVLLVLGGREGGCSKSKFLTALAGFSSGPTWMTSYSSSLSACQSKTPVEPSFFISVAQQKEKRFFLLFSSYLKTRGRKPFPKWLNGGRLVVFNEIRHRVVNSLVPIKQELP